MADTYASMGSVRLKLFPFRILPASIGPPETRTKGIFNLRPAISIPGVILSQFEMHIRASTQCALHIYSTLSAIKSLLGRL